MYCEKQNFVYFNNFVNMENDEKKISKLIEKCVCSITIFFHTWKNYRFPNIVGDVISYLTSQGWFFNCYGIKNEKTRVSLSMMTYFLNLNTALYVRRYVFFFYNVNPSLFIYFSTDGFSADFVQNKKDLN